MGSLFRKIIDKNKRGQALIEYLIIFSFMSLVAINMVKGLGGFMRESMGGLGHALTQQLTIGICKKHCFFEGYKN